VLYVYGKVCVAILSERRRSASVSFLTGEGTGAALLALRGDRRIIIERLVKNQYVLNFLDHEQTVKLHHRAHRDGISSVATIGKTTWLGCAEETRTCWSST